MKETFYSLVMAFVLSLASANYALANPTIEIVVPTPPGGAVDMTARSVSKSLTAAGYENVVVYHPGANGDIGLNKTLEKSNNSILVASSANFVFSHLVFDRENIHARDLQLVGPSVSNAMAFYSADFKTFSDLVSRARREDLPCGTSNSHGEIELKQINRQYGTRFTAVPYKGTGQLIPDVVGGHVKCAYDQIAPYTQLQGKINFLATSGSKQFKSEIPLISSILPGYAFVTWYAVGIPKTSPLLADKKLLDAIHWSKSKELVDPMIERSFAVELADPNLNVRAVKETAHYQRLVK